MMSSQSEKPGYVEIANHYRQLIEDGTLAPGNAMPSMSKVGEEFNVSINTVNRAFRQLKAEGLTLGRPGHGTVVADRPRVAQTGAARIRRLERTGQPYAKGETTTHHTAGLRSCADPDVAEELGVDLYDEVVMRTRVFVRHGKPAVAALSCIHPRALSAVPELLEQGPLGVFWQKLYTERTGKQVTRLPERRGARLASSNELDLLEVVAPPSASVPVLVLLNTFHDDEGPLEYWEDVYAPGLWQVDSE